jgi:hypothetical protein
VNTIQMPSFKQTILLVGTPAVLFVGGLSAMAASSPAPTPAPTQQTQPAAEPAETSDASEANEPALPGGGDADAAGQNVDHQFEGDE